MEPDTMSGGGRPQGDGFMNRDYRSDQRTEQRPMSYMPLSRGSSGVMAQDTIDVTQPGKRYSTASGMADYPVPGAFPYPQQQQQPSQPTSRAPSIKQPPSEYDKLRSPQAGDADQWPLNTPRSTPPASSMALTCPPPEAQAQSHLPANSTRTTTASSTLRSTNSQTRSPKPSSRRKDARAESWTVSAVLRLTRVRTLADLLLRRRALPAMPVLMRARLLRPRRSRSRSVRRRLLSNRRRTNASRAWDHCSAGLVR